MLVVELLDFEGKGFHIQTNILMQFIDQSPILDGEL